MAKKKAGSLKVVRNSTSMLTPMTSSMEKRLV
jgi:hypothetical protein